MQILNNLVVSFAFLIKILHLLVLFEILSFHKFEFFFEIELDLGAVLARLFLLIWVYPWVARASGILKLASMIISWIQRPDFYKWVMILIIVLHQFRWVLPHHLIVGEIRAVVSSPGVLNGLVFVNSSGCHLNWVKGFWLEFLDLVFVRWVLKGHAEVGEVWLKVDGNSANWPRVVHWKVPDVPSGSSWDRSVVHLANHRLYFILSFVHRQVVRTRII